MKHKWYQPVADAATLRQDSTKAFRVGILPCCFSFLLGCVLFLFILTLTGYSPLSARQWKWAERWLVLSFQSSKKLPVFSSTPRQEASLESAMVVESATASPCVMTMDEWQTLNTYFGTQSSLSQVGTGVKGTLVSYRQDTTPMLLPMTQEETRRTIQSPHMAYPVWARIYGQTLPETTSAMLRLDALHRRHNPLGNRLANLVRWTVARTLKCSYAEAYARYDLEAGGWEPQQWEAWLSGEPCGTRTQQLCVQFAQRLTEAGYQVTDEEVECLRDELGEEALVALVQTIAFANFQCRLWMAVDIEVEDDGPLPPVSPAPGKADAEGLPERRSAEALSQAMTEKSYGPPVGWTVDALPKLQPKLQSQKQRDARIELPAPWKLDRLDEEHQQSARRIVWSRMAYGYQPEMTAAWFQCLRAYQKEARPDEVFLNSVFWVVTRSNECFY